VVLLVGREKRKPHQYHRVVILVGLCVWALVFGDGDTFLACGEQFFQLFAGVGVGLTEGLVHKFDDLGRQFERRNKHGNSFTLHPFEMYQTENQSEVNINQLQVLTSRIGAYYLLGIAGTGMGELVTAHANVPIGIVDNIMSTGVTHGGIGSHWAFSSKLRIIGSPCGWDFKPQKRIQFGVLGK